MSLTAEDGTGVVGAESYGTEAGGDTYWGNRTQTAHYTAWNAASTPVKEGALREATAFLDATWGPFYRGVQQGNLQGLLFPRTGAKDDAGYDITGLPACLVAACYELAGRAVSARLADDVDRGGAVKSEQVGPLRIEYFDGAQPQKSYGYVAGLLAPILNGAQPSAPAGSWNWR